MQPVIGTRRTHTRDLLLLAALLTLTIVISACGRPEPSPTPSVPPWYRELIPESPRVVPGRAYPFRLYTHCEVDYAVDFDGSIWDLAPDAGISRTSGLPGQTADPQPGTMTLVEADQARFDYEGGSIPFTRREESKFVAGCD